MVLRGILPRGRLARTSRSFCPSDTARVASTEVFSTSDDERGADPLGTRFRGGFTLGVGREVGAPSGAREGHRLRGIVLCRWWRRRRVPYSARLPHAATSARLPQSATSRGRHDVRTCRPFLHTQGSRYQSRPAGRSARIRIPRQRSAGPCQPRGLKVGSRSRRSRTSEGSEATSPGSGTYSKALVARREAFSCFRPSPSAPATRL